MLSRLSRAASRSGQRLFSSTDKCTVVRGGTIISPDMQYKADVMCQGEKIVAVGQDLEIPVGTEVVDASGCYVMPGGIDPQTHMQLPFMGTYAVDDFYSGTAAAMTGGTTMILDFVIPGPGDSMYEAYQTWRGWAAKAAGDYSFHVAVTWWDDTVYDDMGRLAKEHGVNTFKHFLAYKGAIMADDEILVNSFSRAKELGCMVTIHAENGELVAHMQQKVFDSGVTGPEGHPASRPPEVEGEATERAIRIASQIGVPVYIVHTSSKDAMEAVARARARGEIAFSEVLSQHLVIDDSVYRDPDWRTAAHHVMSPPFRGPQHQEALWNALTSGQAWTTATDHCSFHTDQKVAGQNDFRKIPNGTGGLEDRMSILWHHGVNKGRLTKEQFVAVTSANAAKLFNIYPRKGCIQVGSDADIIVWDPEKSRTISAKTHYQLTDFNIFEGMEVQGVNIATLLRGKLTYLDGELLPQKELRGYGKHIDRPRFSPYFQQAQQLWESRQCKPVQREEYKPKMSSIEALTMQRATVGSQAEG